MQDLNQELCIACRDGQLGQVELLLSNPDVDPGACDNSAIGQAAVNCHTEVVRLLLAHPRVNHPLFGLTIPVNDPPSDNYSQDNLGTVKVLLVEGNIDTSPNGHSAVIKLLHPDNNVDPNAADDYAHSIIRRYKHSEILALVGRS